MATIIPSSGAISAQYMLRYLGGRDAAGADLYLTYPVNGTTPTGSALSLKQLFFARYPNSIHTYNGQMDYGSLRGKCFGIYTSSTRNALHSNSYRDFREGYFTGYFGFGSPTAGTSGVLNTANQGFPIGVRIGTLMGSPFGITVRLYEEGRWVPVAFSTPDFETIGNYSAIIIDTDPGQMYELYLQVWPARDRQRLGNGGGVHAITLTLEEPGGFDSEGPPRLR